MKSNHDGNFVRLAVMAFIGAAALLLAGRVTQAQEPQKQSPEVQQLKEKLQKLEQTVQELKSQIADLQQPAKTPSPAELTKPNQQPPPTQPVEAATKPAPASKAQEKQGEATFQVYGFAMLDFGYQFKQNDPDWFDVVRPTRLPSFKDQFAPDGKVFFGVRQSRLGVKSTTPTRLGELKTTFEFELFGTGVDAGQTTFRLRHAYGELGQFGAGQYWTVFMDINVFPNSLEYWGPTGMVFFRNVQVRWMPIQGDTYMTIALERPGASADQGDFGDRVEIQNIKGRFPLPDLSAEYHYGKEWGYVEAAGIIRQIKYDDVLEDEFDLSGDVTGWGLNLSSNLKFAKDVVRLQYIFGEGVENYMNDAPVDVGI